MSRMDARTGSRRGSTALWAAAAGLVTAGVAYLALRTRPRPSEGGANRSGELAANARKALAMRQEADRTRPDRPASHRADEGMRPIPNRGIAPSGALGQEGHRPVLERSRKVR